MRSLLWLAAAATAGAATAGAAPAALRGMWLAPLVARAAHFQDDWAMEYPRPSGASDSPDADLAIRVDFSSLKGPGQRLLNGIAMGVTSAREVFESQFILDMSLATGVHTDRIVVLNVTEGDVHFKWRWTTTVIRFRILAACPPGLEIYVEMGEAASRRIETIETKEPPCSATPLDARRTCAHPCENSPDVPSVVRDLTNQTQFLDSPLFAGDRAKKVTAATDRHWGLVALDWDMSLRLQFSMDVVSNPSENLQQDAGVGEAPEHFEASQHRAFGHMTLNRGLERFCEKEDGASGRTTASHTQSAYCEWENYFEEDVSRALGIERHRVEVLAVRPAAPDQVLAHFRIFPTSTGTPVADCVSDLLQQVRDPSSTLYDGNITVRTDPSWGVSGIGGQPRKRTSDHLPYAVRGNSSLPYHGYASHAINEAYERCKARQQCARGYEHYYVENATRYHTTQVFGGGAHQHADLFAPFEDWRVGTSGWGPRGYYKWDTVNATGIVRGAHVAPMQLKRLGAPPVRTVDPWGWCHERQACSSVKFNGGLVLNRERLQRDVALQEKLIENIKDDLAWVASWRQTAVLDADGARTRADVVALMAKREEDIRLKIKAEEKVLKDLNGTQCTLRRRCQLFFNTSSITMRGVYEVDGELLIQPGGEEIAVFSFDQIDLGPEVNVTVVGQRPLIIASRSTARFNQPFVVAPGTLGGFPGGYSIGSDPEDVLRDDPRDVPLGDPQVLDGTIPSTNANGPGAPAVRVHLRSVRSEASDVDEVQRVTLLGEAGENLGGFWRLTYRQFRSRSLPPDASADAVQKACEEDLNRAHSQHRSTGLDTRVNNHAPGVGRCVVTTRSGTNGDGEARWTLSFTSQIGAMDLLGIEDHLTGLGARIQIERLQGGNSMGGTFALKFRGTMTRQLAYDATALQMARCLVEDLPHVVAASATRSDGDRIHGECDDGLCEDGPRPGGGLEWTLTLITLDDVTTPRAPVGYGWKGAPRLPEDGGVSDGTPSAAPTYDTQSPTNMRPTPRPTGEWLEPAAPCPNLTVANVSLTGTGSSIIARKGHFLSHRPLLAALNRTAYGCEASFTLAFGGGGAAHGGRGGAPAPGNRDASWSCALGAAARDGAAFFRGGKNSIDAHPAVAVDARLSPAALREYNGDGPDLLDVFGRFNETNKTSIAWSDKGGAFGGVGRTYAHGPDFGGTRGSLLGGSGGALGLMHPYLFEALDPEVLPSVANGSDVDNPQYNWKLNGSDVASRFTPQYGTTKQDPRVGNRRFSLGGRGGAGGGAIELVAVNDLEIGDFCHITVDASDGHESNNAGGGGGSGGSVLLAAGGVIRLLGSISAKGGHGGPAPLGGGGGGGGRVALYANALWRPDDVSSKIDVAGGMCKEWDASTQSIVEGCSDGKPTRQSHRDGSSGTKRIDTLFDLSYDVEVHEDNSVGGAYGTYGSLRVDGRLRDTGPEGQRNEAVGDKVIEPRRSFDGPEFQLAERARPARLSFFVRLDPRNDTQISRRAGTWGGMVVLYDAPEVTKENVDPWAVGGPARSPLPKRSTPIHANASVAVGISLSDRMVHGGGFRSSPGEFEEQGPAGVLGGAGRGAPKSTLLHKTRLRRWYKVDVSLDWSKMVYDVWVDDVLRADDAPIGGDEPWTEPMTGVNRVGVYAISDGGSVRVDEIYVGPDHTMAFRCPKTTRRGPEFETPRPEAAGWDEEDLGGRTTRASMVRHDTHVSKRDLYKFTDPDGSTNSVDRLDNGGLIAFDGAGLVDYRSDVEQRYAKGDLRGGANAVNAGALLTLAGGVAGGGGPSRDMSEQATRSNSDNGRWTSTDHGDAEYNAEYGGNYGAFPETYSDADAPQRQTQFDEHAYTEWYGKGEGRATPTHFWYGEHDAPHGPLNDDDGAPDWLKGGIGACSTDDLISWKREGIALHYANLTDMTDKRDDWQMGCDGYSTIHGTSAGYGCVGSRGLFASRPRVLTADVDAKPDSKDPYASTRPAAPRIVQGQGFVMWMVVNNGSKGRGLAGVASSAHAGGPFHFRRTLYPDGNETRDMAVWAVGGQAPHPQGVDPRSTALLGRTYFAEIEHLLPGAQMQPIWEMAKRKESDGTWTNDFGLSYHRGIYQKDYDDYHDIYLQRWRLEDKPWKVWCVERANPGHRYLVPRGHSTGENYALCPDPEFYKVVEGQGYDDTYFTADGVKSRFMDPDDPSKSEWRPNSVPDVKAQPWKNSYKDGACGIRQKDEDYGLNDPEIPTRDLQDRGNCSNIEDNPLHPTMPDELVKELYVIERRRAKFIAVSALTPDLLDTTSQLDSFEGELEDAPLDALIQSYGQFDWSIDGNAEARIATTFQPPLLPPDDFNLKPRREALGRFHQYSFQPNDRARYSLSCVYDLTCPVNFNDQLIDPDVDEQAVDPAIWWATSTTNYHPDMPLPWTQVAETSWARRRLEEESFVPREVDDYSRPDPAGGPGTKTEVWGHIRR